MKTYLVRDKKGAIAIIETNHLMNIILYQALAITQFLPMEKEVIKHKKEAEKLMYSDFIYCKENGIIAQPISKEIISNKTKEVIAIEIYAYKADNGFYIGHLR